MTTPHEWAALLERAVVYAKYLAEERAIDPLQDPNNNWGMMLEVDRAKEIAASDAAVLRTLAAAFQSAVAISQHGTETRDMTQLILTLPESL